MAQAAPVQADVQRTTLSASDARRQLENPVVVRRGQVQSVTLTIPLLSERNAYLVVRLPDTVVQDLMRQAREVPEADRPAFVRDWIMRNQQAVLEQFVRANRSERRFRYDVVPVPTRMGEVTPRRVEQPPQAERTLEHRKVEEYHQVSRTGQDIVPAGGWRRPRDGELPQAVRERANQVHLGSIPMGDGLVEEYNGKRYYYLKCYHPPDARNRQRHHGISVFVQAEQPQRAEPARAPAREERARVEERAPAQPQAPSQPQARPRTIQPEEVRTRAPFSSRVARGDGSERNPYVVQVPVLVPGRSDANTELATRDFSFTQTDQDTGRSRRTYLRLSFVVARPTAATEPQSTKLMDLASEVAGTISRKMGLDSASALRGSIMTVIRDSRSSNADTLGPYILLR